MVENALYRDPRIFEAAAVGVPDERLGELVTALVTLKPAYRKKGRPTEAELMKLARKQSVLLNTDIRFYLISFPSLPHFASPVMILIQEGDFGSLFTQWRSLI
jgi:acyl-coenzyme A synthetase/AMP-(fatty) acid ligase